MLDGAVTVFDSVAGVEPQSETVWRQADKYGVPRICFVNKMDRIGANYFRCIEMIKDRLGAVPLVIQLPIGIESEFVGIVDLVEMKAVIMAGRDARRQVRCRPTSPKRSWREAQEYRARLVELAVEQDDKVLEAYLGGEEPDADTLRRCIRKGTISYAFVPVLCGSAFKNKGVQPLLDAVVDYLPAPTDVAAIKGVKMGSDEPVVRRCSDDEPFAGLAFKIMTDPFVGSLSFVRVYSGVLVGGTQVLNSVKDNRERIGRMLQMHANHREDIKEARAGDIVALAGLKGTTTGDTLCDPDCARGARAHGIPRAGDRDRGRAQDQERPGEDGPGAGPARDRGPLVPRRRRSRERPDHHQGDGRAASRDHRRPHEARVQGRRQCRRAAGGLSRDHHAPAEVDYTHKKQTGGSGQYARVKMRFEPLPPGSGFEFKSAVVGGIGAEGIHPRRREGRARLARDRRARRVPGDRLQGDPDRRRLSRGRIRAHSRSRSRRARPSRRVCRRRGPSCSSRS